MANASGHTQCLTLVFPVPCKLTPYPLLALPRGVRTVIETLLGETPTPDPLGTLTPERAPDIAAILAEVRRLQGLA